MRLRDLGAGAGPAYGPQPEAGKKCQSRHQEGSNADDNEFRLGGPLFHCDWGNVP